MQYRKIGKTEMMGSIIGLGSEHLDKKPYEVVEKTIHAALEHEINIMDLFMPGEEVRRNIGKALMGNRDKMLIQGHIGSVDLNEQYDMSRDLKICKQYFENLLKFLNTDYIDFGMLFFLDSEEAFEQVFHGGIADYARKLKEQGTIRAIGASSHNPIIAKRVVETGLVDLLMFSINPAFDMTPAQEDVLETFAGDFSAQKYDGIDANRAELYRVCQQREVGITVMKTLGAGKLLSAEHTPFEAPMTVAQCIHYALTRPAVVSALVGCQSAEQVAEAVAYLELSDEEKDYTSIVGKYKSDFEGSCVYCSHCQPCPVGIDIATVNKYLDIALLDKQNIPPSIRQHYQALETHGSACIACGSCEKKCPFSVPVIKNMGIASEIFEKPKVFFESLTFNDGTVLDLTQNSIIVFTGANNNGKSRVLKDIQISFEMNAGKLKVLANSKHMFIGNVNRRYINANFYKDQYGNLVAHVPSNYTINEQMLLDSWAKKQLPIGLSELFVRHIDTEQRLITSNALTRNPNSENHPIYKMSNNELLCNNISKYFKQAFHIDLVVNHMDMTKVPLHVGNAPDKSKYTIAQQDEYYKEVKKLECLEEQGDGMRSFASILLDTFTSEHTITLIDEPEAFLHPPQARLLGKMLSKNNPSSRQLFVSTHSEAFLQGLLDADNENVCVIRMSRKDNINHISILRNEQIKELWSNPILRYSNILSGLFHEKIIVCESDYDCLFYQAMVNAICENKNEIAPDILFTHCGGKGRIKDVIKALHALKVTVVAIPDFDIINNSGEFKPLVEAFGLDWNNLPMKKIFDWLNANDTIKNNIKRYGKNALDGYAAEAYNEVEQACRSVGLFIVPCGEMECFRKNSYEKADWVYNELEHSNLAIDIELRNAREFIQNIIDFKLTY